MKAVEIRKLSESELNKKLFDLQSELFNLRFQLATGQLENPAAIGNVKQDIARVKTIQTERKLNINKEA
ncbi:MAG: 50S ribosomal protein L29 [Anaerococcus sp.]|uniref:Large ribosomal subunit protein uL29 n=3 Tax=Anaerococcus hydrogenalis TaxID=33029 RepID=F0H1W8_9FIRM|nr:MULTISPECIES: 50S ribosomal protein L29 [Anaerococcus]MDU4715258.1 50S ribosomal protein L29 [Anaerococcus sp.]EEB35317.1 ribosomal protein L29 [Anaerococcus hydrogenalis DSM 7454]EGC83543.1 ribosomal protein L29 [Anaerococcus hydrogenalis ACS-025-V-Sch4]MBS5988193.1 50S ribosomal protein L29 [Anaerococcus hydrogenalis]MDK7694804.1 50S ribosomal protein L29 [Anaerococcus hydrogenalis]